MSPGHGMSAIAMPIAAIARSWPVPGWGYAIMPCRTAITAAWVRSLTPSF
jgi:hypothetical protein